MFLFFPFSFLFFSLIIISTILSISRGHVLGVWLGLELNTLRFIAFRVQNFSLKQVESCLKYFLIQSLGSGLWLIGSLINFCVRGNWYRGFNEFILGIFIIMWRIVLKIGGAPISFWVPRVIRHLNWFRCCVITTWQKVIPFFILRDFFWYNYSNIIVILGLIRAIVGGVGGLNQVNLRVLIAYSSIGHVVWIISVMYYSNRARIVYYFRYFICRLRVFSYFWFLEYLSFNNLSGWRVFGFRFEIILGVILLSLAGMPPLTGFIGKWIGITALANRGVYLVVLFLLLGSLINLFYYLIIIRNLVIWSGVWRRVSLSEMKERSYNFFLFFFFFLSSVGIIFVCFVIC